MTTEQQKSLVREFTRIFKNEHNVDGIDHLFASNFKHNFRIPLEPGLAGFKDIGRMMNMAFPDVVVTELDLIAGENKVVERSHAKATNKGEFMGIPVSNKICEWFEIHIYKVDDNAKICEHWVEMSTLELVTQIKSNTEFI